MEQTIACQSNREFSPLFQVDCFCPVLPPKMANSIKWQYQNFSGEKASRMAQKCCLD
jgi:hypothetical protein